MDIHLLVKKLGHPLREVREGNLRNLLSKLESGLISPYELTQEKSIYSAIESDNTPELRPLYQRLLQFLQTAQSPLPAATVPTGPLTQPDIPMMSSSPFPRSGSGALLPDRLVFRELVETEAHHRHLGRSTAGQSPLLRQRVRPGGPYVRYLRSVLRAERKRELLRARAEHGLSEDPQAGPIEQSPTAEEDRLCFLCGTITRRLLHAGLHALTSDCVEVLVTLLTTTLQREDARPRLASVLLATACHALSLIRPATTPPAPEPATPATSRPQEPARCSCAQCNGDAIAPGVAAHRILMAVLPWLKNPAWTPLVLSVIDAGLPALRAWRAQTGPLGPNSAILVQYVSLVAGVLRFYQPQWQLPGGSDSTAPPALATPLSQQQPSPRRPPATAASVVGMSSDPASLMALLEGESRAEEAGWVSAGCAATLPGAAMEGCRPLCGQVEGLCACEMALRVLQVVGRGMELDQVCRVPAPGHTTEWARTRVAGALWFGAGWGFGPGCFPRPDQPDAPPILLWLEAVDPAAHAALRCDADAAGPLGALGVGVATAPAFTHPTRALTHHPVPLSSPLPGPSFTLTPAPVPSLAQQPAQWLLLHSALLRLLRAVPSLRTLPGDPSGAAPPTMRHFGRALASHVLLGHLAAAAGGSSSRLAGDGAAATGWALRALMDGLLSPDSQMRAGTLEGLHESRVLMEPCICWALLTNQQPQPQQQDVSPAPASTGTAGAAASSAELARSLVVQAMDLLASTLTEAASAAVVSTSSGADSEAASGALAAIPTSPATAPTGIAPSDGGTEGTRGPGGDSEAVLMLRGCPLPACSISGLLLPVMSSVQLAMVTDPASAEVCTGHLNRTAAHLARPSLTHRIMVLSHDRSPSIAMSPPVTPQSLTSDVIADSPSFALTPPFLRLLGASLRGESAWPEGPSASALVLALLLRSLLHANPSVRQWASERLVSGYPDARLFIQPGPLGAATTAAGVPSYMSDPFFDRGDGPVTSGMQRAAEDPRLERLLQRAQSALLEVEQRYRQGAGGAESPLVAGCCGSIMRWDMLLGLLSYAFHPLDATRQRVQAVLTALLFHPLHFHRPDPTCSTVDGPTGLPALPRAFGHLPAHWDLPPLGLGTPALWWGPAPGCGLVALGQAGLPADHALVPGLLGTCRESLDMEARTATPLRWAADPTDPAGGSDGATNRHPGYASAFATGARLLGPAMRRLALRWAARSLGRPEEPRNPVTPVTHLLVPMLGGGEAAGGESLAPNWTQVEPIGALLNTLFCCAVVAREGPAAGWAPELLNLWVPTDAAADEGTQGSLMRVWTRLSEAPPPPSGLTSTTALVPGALSHLLLHGVLPLLPLGVHPAAEGPARVVTPVTIARAMAGREQQRDSTKAGRQVLAAVATTLRHLMERSTGPSAAPQPQHHRQALWPTPSSCPVPLLRAVLSADHWATHLLGADFRPVADDLLHSALLTSEDPSGAENLIGWLLDQALPRALRPAAPASSAASAAPCGKPHGPDALCMHCLQLRQHHLHLRLVHARHASERPTPGLLDAEAALDQCSDELVMAALMQGAQAGGVDGALGPQAEWLCEWGDRGPLVCAEPTWVGWSAAFTAGQATQWRLQALECTAAVIAHVRPDLIDVPSLGGLVACCMYQLTQPWARPAAPAGGWGDLGRCGSAIESAPEQPEDAETPVLQTPVAFLALCAQILAVTMERFPAHWRQLLGLAMQPGGAGPLPQSPLATLPGSAHSLRGVLGRLSGDCGGGADPSSSALSLLMQWVQQNLLLRPGGDEPRDADPEDPQEDPAGLGEGGAESPCSSTWRGLAGWGWEILGLLMAVTDPLGCNSEVPGRRSDGGAGDEQDEAGVAYCPLDALTGQATYCLASRCGLLKAPAAPTARSPPPRPPSGCPECDLECAGALRFLAALPAELRCGGQRLSLLSRLAMPTRCSGGEAGGGAAVTVPPLLQLLPSLIRLGPMQTPLRLGACPMCPPPAPTEDSALVPATRLLARLAQCASAANPAALPDALLRADLIGPLADLFGSTTTTPPPADEIWVDALLARVALHARLAVVLRQCLQGSRYVLDYLMATGDWLGALIADLGAACAWCAFLEGCTEETHPGTCLVRVLLNGILGDLATMCLRMVEAYPSRVVAGLLRPASPAPPGAPGEAPSLAAQLCGVVAATGVTGNEVRLQVGHLLATAVAALPCPRQAAGSQQRQQQQQQPELHEEAAQAAALAAAATASACAIAFGLPQQGETAQPPPPPPVPPPAVQLDPAAVLDGAAAATDHQPQQQAPPLRFDPTRRPPHSPVFSPALRALSKASWDPRHMAVVRDEEDEEEEGVLPLGALLGRALWSLALDLLPSPPAAQPASLPLPPSRPSGSGLRPPAPKHARLGTTPGSASRSGHPVARTPLAVTRARLAEEQGEADLAANSPVVPPAAPAAAIRPPDPGLAVSHVMLLGLQQLMLRSRAAQAALAWRPLDPTAAGSEENDAGRFVDRLLAALGPTPASADPIPVPLALSLLHALLHLAPNSVVMECVAAGLCPALARLWESLDGAAPGGDRSESAAGPPGVTTTPARSATPGRTSASARTPTVGSDMAAPVLFASSGSSTAAPPPRPPSRSGGPNHHRSPSPAGTTAGNRLRGAPATSAGAQSPRGAPSPAPDAGGEQRSGGGDGAGAMEAGSSAAATRWVMELRGLVGEVIVNVALGGPIARLALIHSPLLSLLTAHVQRVLITSPTALMAEQTGGGMEALRVRRLVGVLASLLATEESIAPLIKWLGHRILTPITQLHPGFLASLYRTLFTFLDPLHQPPPASAQHHPASGGPPPRPPRSTGGPAAKGGGSDPGMMAWGSWTQLHARLMLELLCATGATERGRRIILLSPDPEMRLADFNNVQRDSQSLRIALGPTRRLFCGDFVGRCSLVLSGANTGPVWTFLVLFWALIRAPRHLCLPLFMGFVLAQADGPLGYVCLRLVRNLLFAREVAELFLAEGGLLEPLVQAVLNRDPERAALAAAALTAFSRGNTRAVARLKTAELLPILGRANPAFGFRELLLL
ncbi:hypothetical protein PAPYR_7638 [Paratrimastix pyriformis]|uniref:Non-specific serine/threonine protein kinase n=1 Tax=Paratrimastix pyriformis TaxID=342808 RepID=A0ABQ8UF46_9EUKA|nr:hypothetical protein PAPYR_7638 [Paratrimastix pyriformis]